MSKDKLYIPVVRPLRAKVAKPKQGAAKGTREEKAAIREKFLDNLAQAAPKDAPYYEQLMGYFRLDVVYRDNPAFTTKTSIKKLTFEKVDFDFAAVEATWNALFANAKEADSPKPVKTKTLTSQQEVTLFLQYNWYKSQLAKIVNSLQKKPRLLTDDEIRAALYYGEATKNKRDALVVANLGLVYAMSARFNFRGFGKSPSVETISAGVSALMRAVERFDVARGFKFSTYACRAILKAMSRLRDKEINKKEYVSLDDSRVDKVFIVPDFAEDLTDIRMILDENKAKLNEQEQQVVRGRYFDDLKLHEIGEKLGLSKERVRQIQEKALKKLQRAMGFRYEA